MKQYIQPDCNLLQYLTDSILQNVSTDPSIGLGIYTGTGDNASTDGEQGR